MMKSTDKYKTENVDISIKEWLRADRADENLHTATARCQTPVMISVKPISAMKFGCSEEF